MQWNDEEVVAGRNQQNEWYEWQTHVAWANSWETHTPQWRRPLERTSVSCPR